MPSFWPAAHTDGGYAIRHTGGGHIREEVVTLFTSKEVTKTIEKFLEHYQGQLEPLIHELYPETAEFTERITVELEHPSGRKDVVILAYPQRAGKTYHLVADFAEHEKRLQKMIAYGGWPDREIEFASESEAERIERKLVDGTAARMLPKGKIILTSKVLDTWKDSWDKHFNSPMIDRTTLALTGGAGVVLPTQLPDAAQGVTIDAHQTQKKDEPNDEPKSRKRSMVYRCAQKVTGMVRGRRGS